DGYLRSLLVAALVEMRSHERFEALLACPAGAPLHPLLAPLAQAEARHGATFLELACAAAPPEEVEDLFLPLAAAEAEILERVPPGPRVHSGSPPG
ncbi:MAG: tRNA-(ms[2]io[6]A)-hydroxylase, partial [Planctomycetes bacterium]|nr:tRNA-(ms[2]io[6]A)-hydroxylase [Planctomycetota bacterium]